MKTIGKAESESPLSFRARTQPRVLLKPVVSVLSPEKVQVTWNKHPAADVAGCNVYRGKVLMRAVTKGTPTAWKDNDPEYPEPTPVEVRDVTEIRKLNEEPIPGTTFTDSQVSLTQKDPDPKEPKHQVWAYVVKAVNQLGTESGPSPYTLTIPSAPTHVLCRERDGMAVLKWDASPERGIAGYRIYKLGRKVFEIDRVTEDLVKEPTFRHAGGRNTTRYWIVAVDALGQEGEPSSPVWYNQSYKGFYSGEWHQ